MRLPRRSKSVECFRAVAIIASLVLTSCSTREVRSLCFLDFENEMCWYNESAQKGRSFQDLKVQQLECQSFETVPCTYGIDSHDLKDIVDSL